jgi:undecaprenyl-diphosphatase
MVGIFNAIVSGLLVAVSSLLPLSPEGASISSIQGYSELLVPSYLGVAFGVLFYFREEFSISSLKAMRGVYTAGLKYVVFSTVFMVLLGYPLWRFSFDISETLSSVINLVIGFLIMVLSLGRFHPLKSLEERLQEEEPTLVDALLSGVAQGIAVLGVLSRTGLAIVALMLSPHEPKKVLEWALWMIPIYVFLKLGLIGTWKPVEPIWIPFSAFLSAFVTSILMIWVLLSLAERNGRLLIASLGAVALVVYSLEVLI